MVFAPFLFIYLMICLAFLIGLLVLIQMQLISSAFLILGLSPRLAILALFLSLIGSYVNIPLYTVESGPAPDSATADNFGVAYTISRGTGGLDRWCWDFRWGVSYRNSRRPARSLFSLLRPNPLGRHRVRIQKKNAQCYSRAQPSSVGKPL